MSVRAEVKARRRKIMGDHISREHAITGRTAYEQWVARFKDLNPVHERINRRGEAEQARIPWWPGQTAKDRERLWTELRAG